MTSAHVDTFARENQPAPGLQPEYLFDLPQLQFAPQLNCATEGLAPLIREEIWLCLETLRAQGQTILVIDKYVQRLLRLANQHTIIERGKVVWHGSNAAPAADPSLWDRYIGV